MQICCGEMQSFCRSIRVIESHVSSSKIVRFKSFKSSMISADSGLIVFEPSASIAGGGAVANYFQRSTDYSKRCLFPLLPKFITQSPVTSKSMARAVSMGHDGAFFSQQILDKEAVEEVRTRREIPDIKPGYIIQLKVEVPENKRRASTIKGIVIARRNAGLNSTFRLRRLVAGVGVESVFPLYSPNIKEMKVLDKKKVRRAKLYYLRDKMNALKKH
ncbi:hypothetical protein HHK36_029554 [Tetracentron sinense]|uniref:Ribosomal protein L19 n=1 Tax=Tetracentron sinense TaxID=13715 RepID=A0A834YD65_TETSI|nr:hypothetical protein HHK36_029554 [Tetracentron sinense]